MMSKKNRNANQNPNTNKSNKKSAAKNSPVDQKETTMETEQAQTQTDVQQAPAASEAGPRTFTLIRINKYGNALYRVEGVRATVAISKTLFAGDPPKSIVVDAGNFAMPGESRTTLTPEKIAKMQETKTKAEARLAKLQAKIAKINAKVGTPVVASTETAGEGAAAAL